MKKNLAAFYCGKKTFKLKEKPLKNFCEEYEVEIEVAYCGICGSDLHIYHGDMDNRVGVKRIIGHEMTGIVTKVGEKVTKARLGNKVTVRPIISCNECHACKKGNKHVCYHLDCLGVDSDGAMQKFWYVPEKLIYQLPKNIPLNHGVFVEPLAVACHSTRLSQLKPQEDVLVIGAGPIGLLISLVARNMGGKVIISEVNAHRISLAKKLGFTVINANDNNLTQTILEKTFNKGMEVVFEVSGAVSSVEDMITCIAPRGRVMILSIHTVQPNIDLFQVFKKEIQILGTRIQEHQDFKQAINILNSKSIEVGPLISEVYSLENIQKAFQDHEENSNAIKTIIQINKKILLRKY